MTVVIDTNVLVSGLLKPAGPPGLVVQMLAAGRFRVAYDSRLMAEYRQVLARKKFGFDPEEVTQILSILEIKGVPTSSLPLKKRLPDKTDEAFLEVALGAQADCLVTGNRKDFPQSAAAGIRILSPAEFLEHWMP